MNCPVCGTKIKPWDWSQNCKKCGTNLFLHDFNNRLRAESVQAEKDFLWWTNMTAQFMYGVKDKIGLARMIASVFPLILLCVPVITFNGGSMIYLNFLMDAFGGGKFFPEGFAVGDMGQYTLLLPAFILLAASLLMAVLAFFSVVVGPAFMNFKAPAIFELIGAACAVAGTVMLNFFAVGPMAAINATVAPSFGLYIYSALMVAETVFMLWFVKYAEKFEALN